MDEPLPLFNGLADSISNWHVAGAVASLAVLIGLLVQLTKTALGQRLLRLVKLDGPARRPWVAAILGALAAFWAAWAAGQPWPGRVSAAAAGFLSGWSATGANESRPSSHEPRKSSHPSAVSSQSSSN